MSVEQIVCVACLGAGTFEEFEPGGFVRSVCSGCLGEGSIEQYICDSHPAVKVLSNKAMCWICIEEDDEYRKSRR